MKKKFLVLMLILFGVMRESVILAGSYSRVYAIWTQDDATLTFIASNRSYDSGGDFNGLLITKAIGGTYGMPRINDKDVIANAVRVVFDNTFVEVLPTSLQSYFSGFSKLERVVGLQNLNTSAVTDMSNMFNGCSALKELDLTGLNTSKVTAMRHMLNGCKSLVSINLTGFDTSNVTDMVQMFDGCSSLTSLDLSSFITSSVTSMHGMFQSCSSLTNLDLRNFDTSNVTTLGYMFNYCSSLENVDISSFNTSNVVRMSGMFCGCEKLNSLDLSNFDTSKVNSLNRMFNGCSSLVSLDLSNFDTSVVTDMSEMFDGCEKLNSLDLSNFDTSKVNSLNRMFSSCSSLVSLDLGNFDTAVVTDMSEMFYGCSNLKTINVSRSWTTASVAAGQGMFDYCNKLVGGRGTTYNVAYTDVTYAHVDCGESNPGYFTDARLINGLTKEGVEMTFYVTDEDGKLCEVYGPESTAAIPMQTGGVVTIPEEVKGYKVTGVCANVFCGCSSVTGIVVPESILNIEADAFIGSPNLHYIDLSKCKNLPAITVNRSSGIFNGVSMSTHIYLPSGKGHSDGGEKNVIIGRICTGGVIVVDGQRFESPVEFETDDVSYDRTFTSGVTATVCLPFTIAAANVTGGKFYSFGGVSDDYVVTMYEVSGDIQASTPYLFVPSAAAMGFDGTVTVGIVNDETSTIAPVGEWDFCGTYDKIVWATEEDFGGATIYGFAANAYGDSVTAGDFVRAKASVNTYINPFRAYLRYDKVSGSSVSRRSRGNDILPSRLTVKLVECDDSTASIKAVGKCKRDVWYTIDGKKLAGEPVVKGLYIKNGSKVVK